MCLQLTNRLDKRLDSIGVDTHTQYQRVLTLFTSNLTVLHL